MAQEIKVIAEPRTCSGSTAARRLRRSGVIPAVLATTGGETALIQLSAHDFERVMSQHASTQLLVSLTVGDKTCLALLREIQRNGMTGRVSHADFGEIDANRKLHVKIQIVLDGEPEGVRNENGVLEQHMRFVEVACLPTDIVESFAVNTEALKLGDDITVAQLNLGDKYTLVSHGDNVVATVSSATPEEVAPVVAEDAEAAQPALSTKKGKAEEAGAAAPAAAPAAAAKPAAKK